MADERKYSFIEEKNGSKRHKQFMKRIKMLGVTALLAVVFGVLAGLVFCVSTRMFTDWFGWKEDEEFSFQTSSPNTEHVGPAVQSGPDAFYLPNLPNENNLDQAAVNKEFAYADWTEWIDENNRSVVMVLDIVKEVDLFQNPLERNDVKSGLIVAEKNEKLYILSSRKELKDDHRLKVMFCNRLKVDADVIAWDKETDLLMLTVDKKRIPKDARNIYKVVGMDFPREIYKGTPIVALGCPNGTIFAADYGMVTGEAADVSVMDGKMRMHYTNLCYTPDGEGFVFNLQGDVLGVIMNRFDDMSMQGIKSFMSMRELRTRVERMINGKELVYVGIIGKDILGEYMEKNEFVRGVYVSEVLTDSPAYHAGLTMGDIVAKVNGVEVRAMDQFYDKMSEYSEGEELVLKVFRKLDNKWRRKEITVKLGKVD